MNPARVAALAMKEWREIVRDRIYLLLAFVMPATLMVVFGYGVSLDVRHMPVVVIDEDRTAASRAYADRFATSEYFDFRGFARDARDARARVSDAEARVVVRVPAGFQEELTSGRTAEVQTLIDGSFTSTRPPRTLEGYVEAIDAVATTEVQALALVRRLGVGRDEALALLRPIDVEVRYLYNPELRSNWTIAPSLIMFVLIFAAPMLMALSVVREKQTGSIFNIYSSTVTRAEFLAGKILPNAAISSVNAVVLWLIAVFHFGAPFKGSLPCFALGTALYVLASTGLGLLVSLLVQTEASALMIVSILATTVGFQYSGLFTPVPSMSGLPWMLAHSFPPMSYLEIIQGTFLKGLGFSALGMDFAALAGFVAVYLVVAHRLFHKRVAA